LVDLMLRFRSRRLAAALALSTAISAGGALAQPVSPLSPADSPVVVTPTNGLVTIESDLQKADNSTGVVTATGNVRIVYPDQRVVATARQAQYFSREGRVVLSGDVDVLQDGGHSIRAERLVYLVERERIVAEPAQGEQVVTLYRLNAPGILKPPISQPASDQPVPQP
jgi:lipopolysaccharide export system protein LptA